MDKVDAIIVGGGLAGLTAAYHLAAAGRQVILLERGDVPGSKNVTGGRMYVEPIRQYLPEIIAEAPFERHVVKEIITVLDDDASVQLEYANDSWRREPYMSYTVLRATFDSWLAEKVGEKGAFVIPKKKVDELLWEDGRVAGIKAGDEEIGAHIVIAADGALSFLAEKAGLRKPLEPRNYAVAVKEIYRLDAKTIEDRFGLQPGEGAANLYVGALTKGMFGGGFLYTNRDTLSLGIVVSIADLSKQQNPVAASQLMEEFSARPEVQRWIRGGELKEYAAHIISEAGAAGIPKLYTDGMLVAGDAAGFSLNLGLTVRGMEFAVASGAIAAGVAVEALTQGDLSAAFLSRYEQKLRTSFVLADMETFRHTRDVLENKRLFTVYPKFISELLAALFTIGPGKKEPLYASAKAVAKKYILNWEACKDLLSMRKM
jgi:electron transfer flavoprotein-quinone oxidoreductase